MEEDELKESLFNDLLNHPQFFNIFEKVFHQLTELVGGLFLDFVT
jgi:hypothetical protein